MIAPYVQIWDRYKDELRAEFAKAHPEDYMGLVGAVIGLIARHSNGAWETPDPERITEIDHGSYQGTLVYVIGETGYQPGTYWYVRVAYGSCSGCDTLQSIRRYSDDPPTEGQLADYMTLALHVVQRMKVMDGDTATL